MKAAPFSYLLADSVEHACSILAQLAGDAKLVAGGQSLVPMMAMRFAQPPCLIDIDRLAGLKLIQTGSATVRTGAGVRQCTLEDMHELPELLPLVHRVLPWVGHRQTRNRGTVGGSLMHADPSAELVLAATVLNANLILHSQAQGERCVVADEFFRGTMITAAADTECLTHIDWPRWRGERVAAAFDEVAIRHGDFAIASAACQVQLAADGAVERLAFGVGGVGSVPLVFSSLAQGVLGERLVRGPDGLDRIADLARELASAGADQTDPGSDLHASAAYRKHLARVLLERVLGEALSKACELGVAGGDRLA